MDINIFSTSKTDRRTARHRHILILLSAILISNLIWALVGNLDSDGEFYKRGFQEIMMDFLECAIESTVLLELSFLNCRMVIRAFQNTRFSIMSLLIQNMLLLLSVLLSAGLISYVYIIMYNEPAISWTAFMCNSIVAFFITSVLFTSFLTNRYRDEAEKALRAQLELKEERAVVLLSSMEKLKLKTDNHFVFNSLATLGNLIRTSQDDAVEFCNSISRMYRYIITKGNSMTVPLVQELEFAREYAKNLSFRLSNVYISIEEAPEYDNLFIPTLSIQGLIENAIKHNSHTSERPLYITIKTDAEQVTVSNIINPLKSHIYSSGQGLKLLEDQCNLICNRPITVIETESLFSVSIPLTSVQYEDSDN